MYALTGANGNLGRLALQHLLTLVPAEQIIATTRNPQALEDFAAKGVVVRRADFSDPTTLRAAFAGATRLLIISTDAVGQRVEQHRAAVQAAVQAGVQHITYTSAPDASTDAPHPVQQEHAHTEIALAASGLAWTALRNNYYTELLPGILQTLQVGNELLVPEGHVKPAWITRDDCARSAAFVLAGKSDLTGPQDLTGPEALGFADLARRWSQLSGHTITPITESDQELTARLIAKGLPEQAATGTIGLIAWFTRNGETRVTNVVEQITGTRAVPVDAQLRTLA
ncbi:NAD(P)-dependent oxidoreductase [Reticulibacter mediterranei]|uniref:NAD(P)-dependent oxidoreductase n=1 Tax=Reticulibacter mediterranei TaxID=2778369 RepID=A0A8J3IT37_9CHLR|nr:NAD(P)H-binding protein [Reticulibacter mediterranei]GHO98045.1 NAD(P)-dependent oxidoreductase [Reticulibacter mediterranei]